MRENSEIALKAQTGSRASDKFVASSSSKFDVDKNIELVPRNEKDHFGVAKAQLDIAVAVCFCR